MTGGWQWEVGKIRLEWLFMTVYEMILYAILRICILFQHHDLFSICQFHLLVLTALFSLGGNYCNHLFQLTCNMSLEFEKIFSQNQQMYLSLYCLIFFLSTSICVQCCSWTFRRTQKERLPSLCLRGIFNLYWRFLTFHCGTYSY